MPIKSPTMPCQVRRGFSVAYCGLGNFISRPIDPVENHSDSACSRFDRRHRNCHPDVAIPLGWTRALTLCCYPPGHADHRGRSIDPELCADNSGGTLDMRLDCGVLSNPVEHDAGGEVHRSKSAYSI